MKQRLPTVKDKENLAGDNNTMGNPTKNARKKNSSDIAARMKKPVNRLVREISGHILSHLHVRI